MSICFFIKLTRAKKLAFLFYLPIENPNLFFIVELCVPDASSSNEAVHLQQRLRSLSTELVTLRNRLHVNAGGGTTASNSSSNNNILGTSTQLNNTVTAQLPTQAAAAAVAAAAAAAVATHQPAVPPRFSQQPANNPLQQHLGQLSTIPAPTAPHLDGSSNAAAVAAAAAAAAASSHHPGTSLPTTGGNLFTCT